MIFSLVSSAQEWLNVKWDVSKKEEETRVLQKQKELEEVERVSGCFCTHTHKQINRYIHQFHEKEKLYHISIEKP